MRSTSSKRWCILTAVVTASATLSACDSAPKTRPGKPAVSDIDHLRPTLHPALRETIAEYAILLDALPLPVEGYGVVAELPGTGSGEMPPSVFETLKDNLYRAGAGSYSKGTEDINPERILHSNLISAVEVHGMIPPMAKRGDSFDLYVNCLPNSQTTSLSGGLLWTTELKVVGLSESGMNDTTPIAVGRGPVFLPGPVEALAGDPAAKDAENVRRAVRSGRIIGGGRVKDDRNVRLELFTPSGGMSLAIERAINSRFPGRDKAASAESDSLITLHVPPEYDQDPMEFIDIVKHMYLRQEAPGFTELKAKELIEAMKDPAAPHRDLSVALQALGRSILPDYLQPQYVNPDPKVRFWCARAGAAMPDVGGMVVLQEFAKEANSPFQKEAVEAIADLSRGGDTLRASMTLLDRLHSKSTADRIAAYEDLVAIKSGAVHSYYVGRKFIMDIIPSDGPTLIFVTQTGAPRIAIIGPMINMDPGLVYISADRALTVSVPEENGDAAADSAGPTSVVTASAVGDKTSATKPAALKNNVALYYNPPGGGRQPVEIKTTVRLVDVIARLSWIPDPAVPIDPTMPYIGASYQRITEMLATLCRDGLIDAQFALQKAPMPVRTATDIISNSRPEGLSEPAAAPATQPTQPAAPVEPSPAGNAPDNIPGTTEVPAHPAGE